MISQRKEKPIRTDKISKWNHKSVLKKPDSGKIKKSKNINIKRTNRQSTNKIIEESEENSRRGLPKISW